MYYETRRSIFVSDGFRIRSPNNQLFYQILAIFRIFKTVEELNFSETAHRLLFSNILK